MTSIVFLQKCTIFLWLQPAMVNSHTGTQDSPVTGHLHLSSYFASMYPIKVQNGWTDRPTFFCGTLHDPKKDLWKVRILKICFKKPDLTKSTKNRKIRYIFSYWKEKLLQIKQQLKVEIEDGREEPWKPSHLIKDFLYNLIKICWILVTSIHVV